MTSKLVVNTIESDTGISSVSFASSISMSSTSKFHFSAAGIDIGADTNINRPASGVLGFNINSAEKLRIDSNGAVMIRTTTAGAHSSDLTIGDAASGTAGRIMIRSASNAGGYINFQDTTGSSVDGALEYNHVLNSFNFYFGSQERFRIHTQGMIGLSGANYGTSGQVLTSGGTGSPVSWTTITGTTINNQADNRVLTATGSTNVLNAESNVHIDGSGRLLVGTSTNNAHTNADNAVISGTGNIGLSIMSTDSGRSSVYFGDSSSSPGSYAGFIDFVHSDNSFNIGRGNDNSLKIDGSGRLLIGTTTEGFATYGDKFTIADSGHCGMSIRSGTSSYGTIYFSDGDDGSADEVRGFIDYNHSTNMLQLGTNGAARLRIDSDGLLGLNVTPSYSGLFGGSQKGMHIGGTTAPFLRITSSTSDQGDLILQAGNSGADVQMGNLTEAGDIVFWNKPSGGSLTERLRLYDGGKLHLKNTITSSVQSHFEIGNGQGSFDFEMSDSSGGSDFIRHVKKRFVSKNTYGLTISSRSTLASSYTGTGDASIKFYYPSAGGGAQAGSQIEFWTNQNGYSGTSEAKRMQISNSGNIGAPNGNNIYNASDERLKENMVELTNGLDKIKKLKPISFNWKDGWDECMSGKKEYGFGAQTTQVVDEMLVESFGTEDTLLNGEVITNPLRVNEKYIIPLLVKAIQEQQEQIETLKTEVDTLKSS